MDYFKSYLDSVQYKRAKMKLEKEPLGIIIEKAKNHDKDAIHYLMGRSMPKLAMYFKRELYPRYYKVQGEDQESAQADFLSYVFDQIATKTAEKKGPFFRFSVDKLTDKSTDEFGSFANYVGNWTKGYFNKKIETERVHKIATKDIESQSEDEDENFGVESLGAEDRNLKRIQAPSSNEDFYEWVKKFAPARAKVLKLLSQNVPVAKIADKLELTKSHIYYQVEKLKDNWEEFKQEKGNDNAHYETSGEEGTY